ncbi:methyltransferase [Nocardia sp. BMG51109]|uniref:methyltransferase n=1 Tax=Nocardia sp. BMG51109 TaxID=1056816 RepID=UPI0004667288|nr:methyltransferase [Nocardia sp. BMG51109]
MSDSDPTSDRTLISLLLAYLGSAAVGAIARVGIADHLAERPRTAAELAQVAEVDEANLQRTLRLLAGAGIFYEDGRGRFHLTPAAAPLVTTAPRSLRDAAIFLTEPMFWQPAGRLADAVRRGSTVFDDTFGMSLWEYFAANPAVGRAFDTGMAALSGPEDAAIADTYDLSGVHSIVDVGGGRGGLLRMLLRHNTHPTGILFDQPQALDGHVLGTPDLAGRWTTVAGDFFEAVPAGGDLYLLKHVLHDWNDDECVRILRCCRRAMPAHARLLIAETLTPEPNTPHYAWTVDLLIMTVTAGRERAREHYETLLAAAGLELTRILPTATFNALSIIEATAQPDG